MDMAIITAAIASAKAAKEFLQAVASLKLDNEVLGRINTALNEVAAIQEKLFEAREQLFDLQKENEELRQAIKAHDDWKVRLGEFTLTKTAGGAVVYESRGDNPKHYACPHCAEEKQVQILQDLNVYSGAFECPACEAKYSIKERRTMEIKGPTYRTS